MSGRQLGQMATTFRSRFSKSETSVNSVSSAVIRRDITKHNKVFAHLFTHVDCEHSSVDGAAYVCLDLTLFIVLICYIRDQKMHDIKLIKFTVDAGQGSLKFVMQILWQNDTAFSGKTYHERRKDGLSDYGGLSDNGARHTFIIGKIMTSTETFASVRFLTDRYSYLNLRAHLAADCEIIGPNDLKMGALLAGIGPSGSRHPSPCTLFSMFEGHSHPDIWRTPQMIIDKLVERREAESKRGEPYATAKLWDGVDHEPCRILKELFLDKPVADFLVPPQLHLLLGLVSYLMGFLKNLSTSIYFEFLAAINVIPNKRYSDTDFHGNPSRKILRSHRKLRELIEGAVSSSARRSTDPQSEAFRHVLLHLLVDTMAAFTNVVAACMGGPHDPKYKVVFEHFFTCFGAFASQYQKRTPVVLGRVENRFTMKLECLRVEVPRRLEKTGRSMLPDTEQGAEGVHSLEAALAADYKIARTVIDTGLSKPQKKQCLTKQQRSANASLSGRTPGIANPSDSTRSGQSGRQRKSAAFLVSTAEPQPQCTHKDPPSTFTNIPAVRCRRLQQVLAWNRSCLPSSSVNVRRIIAVAEWRCSCEPPINIILRDHSRGGKDLRICGCCPYNPGPTDTVGLHLSFVHMYYITVKSRK